MSTYESTALASRFAALAPESLPGDWDDVVLRAGKSPSGLWHPELFRGGRRRHIVLALATLLIVIAVAASAVAALRQIFWEPYPQGRVTRTVDGVRFSARIPRNVGDARWENGPSERAGTPVNTAASRSFSFNRSTVGGQAAEAVIFWTAFPDGGQAGPCPGVLSGSVGPSAADLAAAIAQAPGANVVDGPRRVNLGGRPAQHVTLRVRRRGYCPGYLFTWQKQQFGAFWPGTSAGDKISVWIVDVDGKRIVIEAETKQPGSGGPTALNIRPTLAEVRKVEAEIAQIIGSIRFN
jgi:hypothetical protein